MPDLWTDFYEDVESDGTPPAPINVRPRLVVEVAVGAGALEDQSGPGFFRLGSSVLGGPDILGDMGWADITADVKQVSRPPAATAFADSASPSTCSFTMDGYSGDYDMLNPAGRFYGQLDVGTQIRYKAVDDDTGTVYPRWRGYIDDVIPDYGWEPVVTITASDGLASLGRGKIAESPPVFDGDGAGQRITRILDAVTWPTSLRAIAAGTQTVQAETYGDYALPLIQRIVDTELGSLFVDGQGRVTFFDRLQVFLGGRSTTVQATFSDEDDPDVIEYEELVGELRRGETFNHALVTREGGIEQEALDVASKDKRGLLTFTGTVGTMLRTDKDAAAVAQWVVSRFKVPTTRFPQIAVDATTQDKWTELLALQHFDRVALIRGGRHAIDREVLIEGIGEEITPEVWKMTFPVRDAESWSPFVLGRSVLGGPDLLV